MVFNPNPAMPWFNPTGGWTPPTTYAGSPYGSSPGGASPGMPVTTQGAASPSSGRPRFYDTANGPVTLPADWPEEDARKWVAGYDKYIATQTQAWQQASGIQKRQIEAQIEDAKRGREVQMEIADLQAKTSRYGVDEQSKTAMRSLQEEARQYDLTHGVEMEKLGIEHQRFGLEQAKFGEDTRRFDLNFGEDTRRYNQDFGLKQQDLGLRRAQTATDYLSAGADRYSQASDFLNLSGRVLAGQPGVGTGSGMAPQPKTMADFDALQGGGIPGRQINTPQAAAGAAAGGGAGSDDRIKAIKALVQAAPPSDEPGMDHNGYQVLQAAKAIYSMNLTPAQQASINGNKQYKAMLGSAGSRLGQNPDAWWQQQRRGLPGMGSARAA